MTNTFNNPDCPSVAYFSMEFGLRPEMKTYAGGLGVLAGDTLKTAADMGANMVGVTLLYKKGYFRQVINEFGEQLEEDDVWDHTKYLQNTGKIIEVKLNNESIFAEIWKYEIKGVSGKTVNVLFLNADFEQNSLDNQYISYNLYTPAYETRLRQEILLGLGGVYALKEIGYEIFDNYHLNESHAAFSILALQELLNSKEEVKKRIVFTTHTPEEHGHKRYQTSELTRFFNEERMAILKRNPDDPEIHMTKLCFDYSKFRNAVSKKHCDTSKEMFPEYQIDYITNGVHVSSWAGEATQQLFNKYIPNWANEPERLKEVEKIPEEELQEAFALNKQHLINYIRDRYGITLGKEIFTIGFGRRVDMYKRSSFIFENLVKLQELAEKFDGLQIIMSGKAYFNHEESEERIADIFRLSKMDLGKLNIIFLENYGMKISKLLVKGTDIWLNNPIKPREASGTSGMKAALNGIPSFSTIDGWWVEGWKEGVTGWSIGTNSSDEEIDELTDLYSKLENIILPLYKNNKKEWGKIMRDCIAINGSYFNTHRMLKEYMDKAYI